MRTFSRHRFEAQLTAVKERLEAAKVGSTRGLGSPNGTGSAFSFGGSALGSRIAKPLRGGGVVDEVQSQSQTNKRSSWFFSGQK